MSSMSMGDYGKDAPTGGGIRLRILYDAIINRQPIEVESGGKALILTSESVLSDMKNVLDGKFAFDIAANTSSDINKFLAFETPSAIEEISTHLILMLLSPGIRIFLLNSQIFFFKIILFGIKL